jgi:hypothetical protein
MVQSSIRRIRKLKDYGTSGKRVLSAYLLEAKVAEVLGPIEPQEELIGRSRSDKHRL